MIYRHHILILFFFAGLGNLLCQDEAYKGGPGDGFTSDTFNLEYLNSTMGGNGDGFSSSAVFALFNEIYIGGEGDGASADQFLNSFNDFTKGGISDGFGYDSVLTSFNSMYSGGFSDGFSYDTIQTIFNPMYSGGDSDGFAGSKYGHIIYWTGMTGTGWNVSENWENDIIPNYCNPVIIPAGVPNFPAVNAGILRVGYYKNEGDYKCEMLKIEAGADMLTRVNCFVENYNLILIKGKFFVKNPATNALTNLWDGLIRIKPNAEMIVKE